MQSVDAFDKELYVALAVLAVIACAQCLLVCGIGYLTDFIKVLCNRPVKLFAKASQFPKSGDYGNRLTLGPLHKIIVHLIEGLGRCVNVFRRVNGV